MEIEPICGIVILNYNTFHDTINCIESVLKYNTAKIKIVIVDNGSTDSSNEIFVNYVKGKNGSIFAGIPEKNGIILQEFSYVRNDKNLGYAKGNNLGIELLKKDVSVSHVLILNSDVLFVEDIILDLETMLMGENAAIASPCLYKKNNRDYDYNCARYYVSYWEILIHFLCFAHEPKWLKNRKYILLKKDNLHGRSEIGMPSGSCMLFSKSFASQIGIFDSNTFLYYEENIIAERSSRSGKKILIDFDLRCIHLGATSIKKSSSRMMTECEVKSASYYVLNVQKNGIFKRAVFSFACKLYLVVDDVKRFLKHYEIGLLKYI